MFKYCVAPVLALLLILFAQIAHAFFDPPWTTPAAPTAGETVSVNIHGGICDAILETQGYPKITREGTAIRLRVYGTHYETGSDLCTDAVGTVTQSIGSFSPGSYILTVELAYLDGFGVPSILSIGVVPFTVAAPPAPAAPVPATGTFVLSVLILMLVAAAWAAESRRLGSAARTQSP